MAKVLISVTACLALIVCASGCEEEADSGVQLDSGTVDADADADVDVDPDADADAGRMTMMGDGSAAPAPSTSDIEAVVIDARAGSGEPYPVVLFRDGWACTVINFLAQTELDAASHYASNPGRWTRWRRVDGKVQLERAKSWVKVAYGNQGRPKARGATLNGSYTNLTGTSVISGASSIKERTWHFMSDGRFTYGRETAISVADPAGGPPTNARGFPPGQRGRYEIDGYLMQIHIDDGDSFTTTLVDDGDVIYIGGVWYDD